jgi:pyrimidine-nucleoside phosphorylase/thymidine phosphorylase
LDILTIIEHKKQGRELAVGQIASLVSAFTAGTIPDYQMAAFLMAVWFRGMTPAETAALTEAMLHSGSELDLSSLTGPTADKHSTGGVGDKVSLLLAPLAAACGLQVPMLSGRGLGHTGGTLDKLAAIPGYRIHLTNGDFLAQVQDVGCAIIGQSADIAPADGKIYALRDVTATVDCVPLITASILSKKLAAGPQNIVIDLKIGSGAFMPDRERAEDLARALIATVQPWQRRLAVVFSDMSQPLGRAVGHANETIEAFAALRPAGRQKAPRDLVLLTEELVAEMILLSGRCEKRDEALALLRRAWDGGEAWTRLQQWVSTQGGRLDTAREDFGLQVAPRARDVTASRGGHLAAVDCRQIGYALGDLGGARRRKEDILDLTAGIDFQVSLGDEVQAGQPLAVLYVEDRTRAETAAKRIEAALTLSDKPIERPPLVLGRRD